MLIKILLKTVEFVNLRFHSWRISITMEPRPSNGMNQKATVRKLPKEKDAQNFGVLLLFCLLIYFNFSPELFFF